MRRIITPLVLTLAMTAPLVAAAPSDVAAAATAGAEAVIRWDPSSTVEQRDAVLASVGAVRTGTLSTLHDVDVVAAAVGSEHDVELHDHVVDRREKVAEREAQLEEARAWVVEFEAAVADAEVAAEAAEAAVLSAEGDALDAAFDAFEDAFKALDHAVKDLEDAVEDEIEAQERLDKAVAELAEERSKHGDEIVKALRGEDHVLWVEERVAAGVGDDRFHAWPFGLSADRFHAWPNGEPSSPGGEPIHDGELAAVHALATGAGVTVAVLDTGAAVSPGPSGAGYDFVDDDADPVDVADGRDTDGDGLVDEAHGHGGIVASVVAAVAPDATILHYRVLDADGAGEPHAVALAIEDAVARGADIINVSAGSDTRYASRVLRDAFKDAARAGVVVVAAAGNAGTEDKRYPAAEKDVVAVSALDGGGAIATFSSRGKWAEVAAPGVDVAGVLPDGRAVWWSGSSFASPRVAGQFALLRELHPELDIKGMRHVVRGTARRLEGSSARAVDLLASLEDD